MKYITADIDQFWRVTKITSSVRYRDTICVADVSKYIFIPYEIFNMIHINYIYFHVDSYNSKNKLDRIPLRKRINLRNLNFGDIRDAAFDSYILEFIKPIQQHKTFI